MTYLQNRIDHFLNSINANDPKRLANIVYIFIGFHCLLWFCVGLFTQRAPHWDNVEALVWSDYLEWGYFKHPPFSTWVVRAFSTIFGREFWVTYLVGQINIALMLLVVWRISLLLTTPARALCSVVLTTLILYFNLWGVVADQNTLSLLPISLLLWTTLLAVRHQQWWRWLLVGLIAAICILTKYSVLNWFAVIGVWLVLDHRMRRAAQWMGVVIAILLGLIAIAPHVEWLHREDYLPFKYLQGQSHEKSYYYIVLCGKFLLSQLGRIAPLVITLVALNYIARRTVIKDPSLKSGSILPQEWNYLYILTIGPIVMTVITGAMVMNLRANWGTTLFILAGLFSTRWLPNIKDKRLVSLVLELGIAVNVLIAGGVALTNSFLVDAFAQQSRSNFPSKRFAELVDMTWARVMGDHPLKIVAAETWFAGIAAIESKHHPQALLQGKMIESPWITEKMLHDCGALILVDISPKKRRPPPPAVLELLKHATHTGTMEMPWSRRNEGPPLKIEWGIIEPTTTGLCTS